MKIYYKRFVVISIVMLIQSLIMVIFYPLSRPTQINQIVTIYFWEFIGGVIGLSVEAGLATLLLIYGLYGNINDRKSARIYLKNLGDE